MQVPRRSAFVAFLVVATALVGGAFVVDEYRYVSTAETTTGTVRVAEVETYTTTRPSLWGSTEYRANVSYTYTVDGEQYRSDDVYAGSYASVNSGRRMATARADYAVGKRVAVHYDPGAPGRSFLVARYSFLPGYALVAVAALLGAELLTPGTWLVDAVADRLTGRRDDERGPPDATYEWEASDDGPPAAEGPRSAGPAVSGRQAVGVWALAALAVLGVIAHYVVVSAGPTSVLAGATAVVGVVVPVARVVTEPDTSVRG
ncbi:DUF3592 domain-containing protein [Halorarius halobius]|uniref:DUF3592 domain-containing protein n=1 Tax=Halorarius halobius TaxID=2962671 RepID=UPI0020CD4C48|nr:DUF3592 domain-containing protein [Halorarius halobius]